MKPAEILSKLEALGDEKRRAYNIKNGAGDNQFGVHLPLRPHLDQRDGKTAELD